MHELLAHCRIAVFKWAFDVDSSKYVSPKWESYAWWNQTLAFHQGVIWEHGLEALHIIKRQKKKKRDFQRFRTIFKETAWYSYINDKGGLTDYCINYWYWPFLVIWLKNQYRKLPADTVHETCKKKCMNWPELPNITSKFYIKAEQIGFPLKQLQASGFSC